MNGVYAFPLSGANANTWVAITTTGTPPSRRSLAAAVYDARRDRLVVHGGQAPGDVSGTVYANEWQLSYGANPYTGTWTQLSAPGTGPTARGGHVAAYDSTEDRMVCFGGRTGASTWSSESWSSSWGAGAPWQVTDFSPTVHCTSIDFAWTDPRDDKADGSDDPGDADNPHFGPGVLYDVRSSTQPLTNANWASATSVLTGAPSGPGSPELVNISVGSCSSRRYYAVRVSDESNGLSWVSNSTGNIGTPCPHGHQICIDDEFARGTPREAGLELVGEQPAHGAVTMSYSVPSSLVGAPYDLSVYDVSGRRILNLERGTAAAGAHNVVWNSQSDRSVAVRSGVYFIRLRLGSEAFNRPVVVLGP
jgi:hypothetical protein